eukprot:1852951-Pyramimonas_sp.AAC.1
MYTTQSHLQFEIRFGSKAWNAESYQLNYDHAHKWARDLPICSADHFFKRFVHYLDPETIEESTTGAFQWISKVYQNILKDSIAELPGFTKDAIHEKHPALQALRDLFKYCTETYDNPDFPVWEELVETPAAP